MIALVGVLALTLDFGFVLLARRQMQTGVNAAALEGLRDIDGQGRENARDLMINIYDDNFDPSENETTIGAGIDKSLIQGDGYQSVTIGAGEGLPVTLANRSQYIYRPNPELNTGNEVHGDFVRGDLVPGQPPNEPPTYQRTDFIPNPTGNAFLSRLRRTHTPNGLDQVPGVSSSGGGLPLIIGNLAWFAATDPQAGYSIRRDGVIVRATAIAEEQVAVRVWESNDNRFYSPLPYVISKDNLLAIQSNGNPNPFTTVGELVKPPLVPATPPADPGYIAVYANFPGGDFVIGFRLHDPDNAGLQHNASPRLQDAWSQYVLLSNDDQNAIRAFHDPQSNSLGLLKVPALVRSVR